MGVKVFFSYSHLDEDLRDQLEVQLTMLKRHGLIESWHDRRITAGDQLDQTIDKHLDEADIILLLLSPDFLASGYCYNIEKANALKKHKCGEARVISVILRPCDWLHTDLAQYLVTPKDGKAVTTWANVDEAFLDVSQSIRRAVDELQVNQEDLQANDDGVSDVIAENYVPNLPRSSNLRLKKDFSESNIDDFLNESFDFMARFFDGSLDELKERNTDIETRFRKIDANCFTTKIYKNGAMAAACSIRLGSSFGKGITYSYGENSSDGSMNEMLSVEHDDQKMFLKSMGMATFGSTANEKLSQEGGAEYFWALMIGNLQG